MASYPKWNGWSPFILGALLLTVIRAPLAAEGAGVGGIGHPTEGTTPRPSAAWLDGGTGLASIFRNPGKEAGATLWLKKGDGAVREKPLEGEWNFFLPRRPGELLLLHEAHAAGESGRRGELYRVHQGDDVGMVLLDKIPSAAMHYMEDVYGCPVWSPDGAYLLASIPRVANDSRRSSGKVAVDMATGKATPFAMGPGESWGRALRWLDNRNVAAVGSRDAVGKKSLAVYGLNAVSGACVTLKEFPLRGGEEFHELAGARHVLVTGPTATDTFEKSPAISLLDLESGIRTSLPPRKTVQYGDDYTWNAGKELLAYASPDEGDGGLSLVVATPEKGVTARKRFSRGTELRGIRISPDGRRVLYLRGPGAPARWEAWRMADDYTRVVRELDAADSVRIWMELGFGATVPFSLPSWSPDSRSVALWTGAPSAQAPDCTLEMIPVP